METNEQKYKTALLIIRALLPTIPKLPITVQIKNVIDEALKESM